VDEAKRIGIDPRLLLAVLIRESGDRHMLDPVVRDWPEWLQKKTKEFSIGIANLQMDSFNKAKEFSNGVIDYDWTDTARPGGDQLSIRAAAFFLAYMQSQLPNESNPNYTKEQLARA
jgi:hypothetical protein